jgi:hypothetical protein
MDTEKIFRERALAAVYPGNSLVQTFVAQKLISGMRKTDIANELSLVFDRSYTIQKLNLWLQGKKSTPRNLHDYMLKFVLSDVIREFTGRRPGCADEIFKRLTFNE